MRKGDARTHQVDTFIGKGIYSVGEASKLTGVSTQNIRRWLYGYYFTKDGTRLFHPPVLQNDYAPYENTYALSFLDLMEIRFVDQFRIYGVSLQTIRIAAQRAAGLVEHSHPFATKKFFTDKTTILAQIVDDTNEPELVDLAKRQYEIHDVVLPFLYEGIDFSEFDTADRWWPRGRGFEIVLDPHRSFGRPIVDGPGIPTEILAAAYHADGSIERVAKWYEIQPQDVRAAVEFELNLAA